MSALYSSIREKFVDGAGRTKKALRVCAKRVGADGIRPCFNPQFSPVNPQQRLCAADFDGSESFHLLFDLSEGSRPRPCQTERAWARQRKLPGCRYLNKGSPGRDPKAQSGRLFSLHRATGLIRLLSVGLRALSLLKHVVRERESDKNRAKNRWSLRWQPKTRNCDAPG